MCITSGDHIMPATLRNALSRLLGGLDLVGLWIGLLSLRLMLGWDFFESGLEKFRGENWFMDIQDRFPFPFSLVPPEISWQMATWFELAGGIALVLGLATRFFSVSLFVLTLVAIASVHWPESWNTLGELMQGYVFTDRGFGNFKLPALFLGMLLPLILIGPGRLSADYLLRRKLLAATGGSSGNEQDRQSGLRIAGRETAK
jgi:putative oxidoreductase